MIGAIFFGGGWGKKSLISTMTRSALNLGTSILQCFEGLPPMAPPTNRIPSGGTHEKNQKNTRNTRVFVILCDSSMGKVE